MNISAQKLRFILVISIVFGMSGCATQFIGEAHVVAGKAGCQKKCQSEGLEMVGMVYMGEYSSACVCCPPGSSTPNPMKGAVGAAAGAAAGVMMQSQRAQQQAMK